MNSEIIFRILSLLLLAAALTISGYHRRKADREAGALDKSTGQGLLVTLRLIGLIGILPLFGYFFVPAWVGWARVSLPEWVRWGAALVAASLVPAFLWIFRSLGQNISPTQATRSGHELVTHGPYRYLRHPLYSAGFLFFGALSILTGLWWIGLGLLVGMTLIFFRTPREEAQLKALFGEEYTIYQENTGRFFPRLRRSRTKGENDGSQPNEH